MTEIERVADAVQAVKAGDWTGLGRLLLASHASLRDDFEVSCAELDTAVQAAVGAGALGARMTGGGFGGSSVALVPVDGVDRVAAAVDAAFAAAGFAHPQHLLAPASAAAGPIQRPDACAMPGNGVPLAASTFATPKEIVMARSKPIGKIKDTLDKGSISVTQGAAGRWSARRSRPSTR